ncbi:sensor histidine kinase [Oxalicibacterium flavum]|uniref:histidine kinase n=1 Tax=Oxalicibacterium flavum TaxID=179467 RepID=A0A8J2XXJ3_9BURK|nr:7TM diverse intracellular signaling domain-containing protein [Oxalicibacterium flavum]GGC12182.1 sensor histidine kinase [Oxalicibacterium flavum]
MKWLAALLWLALLLCTPARAAEPATDETCTARILSIQTTKAAPDGTLATDAPWQTVTLPDNWTTRWPDYSGTAWYRIDWKPQCAHAQLALAIESIVMAGEVHVNDNLIWRDASLSEPLSRSWNMPRYWRLPQAMLHDGTNTLLFRVVGVAGQSPGLGPVYLGEAHALQQQHDERWWRNRTLFTSNLTISMVLSGLFFCIWLTNRKQGEYGWYALMSLFWVLFAANILATTPWPFGDTVTAARANAMALVLYVACFCVFTWRFGRQSLPRIEKALWAASAILLVFVACMPAAMLQQTLAVAHLVPATFFFINCLQFPVHALRTRQIENRILAVALLLFFGVALHDLLLMLHVIGDGKALTPVTSIAAMLCMSGVLGLRHARNMRRIERFNEELEQGIDHARNELEARLAREHELVLANTRLQERLRISHDLHDGLGGSLVRMMAMVEQAEAPLQNQQFLSLLKLIRDDLRQTIDAGSSNGVKVPATPTEWIAPLRHRFMQLFDDRDTEVSWTLPPHWRTPPNALQCLALTRLAEEALINIVKHSRARHVQLRMWQPADDLLVLEIEDDGVGFDVDAVRHAGISVGMRSMHARIAAVGGRLDVQSVPGRTVLTATLRLAPASP